MAMKPPTEYSPAVRKTLHYLVAEEWVERPAEASGEAQYLLCHARRLHESFEPLPAAGDNPRCLVVGSWGLEVPYLREILGWHDITCICAPAGHGDRLQHRSRPHPNGDGQYEFKLMEHDIEGGRLPFAADTFGLVVFWGCLEHLRDDPEFALYEINRVSAPGAAINIVTDNAVSFQATHEALRGFPMPMRLHHPSPEGHWRLYTPLEVSELLTGTGWTVDLLTSIVPDAPVYWKWWKRWLFRKLVADYRRGYGYPEAFWNSFVMVQATKTRGPDRSYPRWLFKDPKIEHLKLRMLELDCNDREMAKPA